MFLIGIAGGSGSGKTTFAKKILECAKRPDVALLHLDAYYRAEPPADVLIQGEPNFDHPDAFDWPLLREHLSKLKAGERIDAPTYDYTSSRRRADTQSIGPCEAVLIEGIYTLWDGELRSLLDVKMYLHVDADIRFIRRLHRDVRERGRSLDSIIRQYYDAVRPMHHEFIETTRQYADIVVGEESDVAAEVMAARIRQVVRTTTGEEPSF